MVTGSILRRGPTDSGRCSGLGPELPNTGGVEDALSSAPASRKYPDELRERATRMVLEARRDPEHSSRRTFPIRRVAVRGI